MKKLIAIILTVTLVFSCAAIPACAAEAQESSPSTSYFETIGNIFKIAIKYVYNFIAGVSNLIEDIVTPDEKVKPALVAQDGKEDTVVIDRKNNVIYGLKLGLRIENVGDFVKVNDDEIGKLTFVQRFGNRISCGDTINVIDKETNEVIESFTVVIFSDVYNNGTCNVMDQIYVEHEAEGKTSWSDPKSPDYCYWRTLAADLDKDGVITDNDALLILMCVMGQIDVDQTTGKVITPDLRLTPKNGKEDTVVIDRENNIIYGLKLGLRIENIGDFVKVNYSYFGKLDFVQRFDNRISSGDKINVVDKETNEVIESFTVVIFSDVYNNGTCNVMDQIYVEHEAEGKTSWSDPKSPDYCYWRTLAADLDKDGVITDNDVILITQCNLGSIDVNQTTGEIIK